jgi:hypothetical protein
MRRLRILADRGIIDLEVLQAPAYKCQTVPSQPQLPVSNGVRVKTFDPEGFARAQ